MTSRPIPYHAIVWDPVMLRQVPIPRPSTPDKKGAGK